MAFYNIERVYYPFLAVIGVIVNVLTIVILYREKCGLSKDSTTYLMAITGADLLIIFIDLILRQIPTRYEQQFIFMTSIPLWSSTFSENLSKNQLPQQSECQEVVKELLLFAIGYFQSESLGAVARKMLLSFLSLILLQLLNCTPGNSQARRSGNVRLVNGGSPCAGRLEILHQGRWGTVGGYNWDLKDAAVVCRELGCGMALSAPRGAHFGEGSGTVVTSNVQCSRTESALRECTSNSWSHRTGWLHSNDAGVICSGNVRPRLVPESTPCAGRLEIHWDGTWRTVCKDGSWSRENDEVICELLDCGSAVTIPLTSHFGAGSGPVIGPPDCGHQRDIEVICSGRRVPRLVDGESQCSGRLEMLYAGNWETVCDLHWDLNNANVVCAQLNCGVALSIPTRIRFGNGTGPIRRNRLECKGSEKSLLDCPLSPVSQYECTHRDDVSVICSNERWPLRLTHGGSRCDGRVEIYQDGNWGQLLDKGWDLNDANVVCRQLGCGVAIAAYNSLKYGQRGGTVWANNIQCKGNETHLRNCGSVRLDSPVPDSIGVGVLCSDHIQIRLSGGGTRCAGRLEIYYNGTWGSVCDDSWDLTDAGVVCRQLGCGRALNKTLPASCEPNSGPIWLDEVDCSGKEAFLWKCPSASWNNHDCHHKEDVTIVCSEHKELRLVNGKHRCEGRVEVFYNGTWGTVCSENLDDHDAQVICKQLECGDLVSQDTKYFEQGSGQIWLDEVECNFQETTLWQCQSEPWGQHNCNHLEDTGVICSEINKGNKQPDSSNDCNQRPEAGFDLRLVGGNSNCTGTVEILYNNTWGTVCDDSWDLADARVVCRQLACGPALLASGGTTFAQADGVIWLDEVKCTGSESFLSDCPSLLSAQPDCDHKEDARVICSEPDLSPNPTPATSTEQGDKTSSILPAVCITLAALILCELIALLAVRQRKFKIKVALSDHWDSTAGLYQGIYEEIENIAAGKHSAQTHGSVSSSRDSLNHIEYYTSQGLGENDPGPANPEGNSSSTPGPFAGNYDDIETETNDTRDSHLLLDPGPEDFSKLRPSSGDGAALEYSTQRRFDPDFPLPSRFGNNGNIQQDVVAFAKLTAADRQ
ncbi:deleted in malignant brain tumors 1 protein-like [Chiloscyllium plagiosum]|uniref:deleted in malignant brain tumors 1 protein-like n=1 Tax=Chiloscyllium plagiosum TaxID=36176 RepID=UPI001CB7EAC5|nr:deleted in malignant brain tumors 1 protein-like [Chiloscyllium plagiosum]